MTEPGRGEGGVEAPESVMRCDFCDREVQSVRRVALDGEYERLRTPHAVMYSCPDCFDRKNQERAG